MPRDRHGSFFEDFRLNQVIRHATPRTVTEAEASLYIALTGSRHVPHSALTIARSLGYRNRPLDDFLVFNIAFGKTVAEISLNAVANLGYAELRFIEPVFSGDTLRSESVVIGLKENSSRKTGIVYVRSTCYNQDERPILSWVRWVMVLKRRPQSIVKECYEPEFVSAIPSDELCSPGRFSSKVTLDEWCDATGSRILWNDFAPGERIDHPLGMTIEEADHLCATRLYQNNARVHFDAVEMQRSKIGKRLVYGGHVISICRALTYDGLENVLGVLAINGGQHVSPTVAGDTLYAYSEVIDKWNMPGRSDVGALRLRLVGLKNFIPVDVPSAQSATERGGRRHPAVVLDLDYTVSMPCKWLDGNSIGAHSPVDDVLSADPPVAFPNTGDARRPDLVS
ncbi:MaoC family dehydratase [Bradyrhizobium erythrophlei]|uniref:MaoC family dehydratase n=1 Tax=Bradyrhizobium erythrophlei TaxID=1437360 RepID=UPI0035E5B165